ncbi:MAG: MBL fold metallo-hydrolase [Lachnospiraceae bacterium]
MNLCSIASGSSGNCIYTGTDQAGILIDAGISAKRITEGLHSIGRDFNDIKGIFISHEHSDHVKGLGVLARKYHLPIYATAGTLKAIKSMTCLGKVDEELYHEISADEEIQIEDLTISPFAISHDAVEPVAYRLSSRGKSAAVATDLGFFDQRIVDKLQNLDVLLLEANHDIHMLQVGSYPYPLKQRILSDRGHLSNEAAGKLLCHILHDDLKAVYLGHLSQENNYEELAYETVRLEIALGSERYQPDDFRIEVAKRESVSGMIEF